MDRTAADYQKDLLWQTALETFYRVAYTESLMTSALQMWRPIDGVVKSIVSIASIASVMVGWMAWGTPTGKVTWLLIAGSAAFLALLHVILKISDRVPLEQFKSTFEQYREWLLVGSQMLKDDFLLTRRHRQKVQEKLNQQMGDMIV